MIAAAWVCLLSPLVGALTITVAGGRISRRTAGWIATLSTFVAFGGALVAFFGLWAADPSDRLLYATLGNGRVDPNWFNSVRNDLNPALDHLRGRGNGTARAASSLRGLTRVREARGCDRRRRRTRAARGARARV